VDKVDSMLYYGIVGSIVDSVVLIVLINSDMKIVILYY